MVAGRRMSNPYVPGIQLCGRYYWQVIRPILDEHVHGLPHAAALLGNGSEVLGFDTELSTDHDWSPRVVLFLRDEDHVRYATQLVQSLESHLPESFSGYPTRIELTSTPNSAQQRSTVHTLRSFSLQQLGVDATQPLAPADWLVIPQQLLLSVVAGAVYHDDIGLQRMRDALAWYPHDVWLYVLAAGWTRISQEEHLMGRAGMVGDEIGSALIGARLVRDIMRLCFLMERVYAPYLKWFGMAFKRLRCAAQLETHLQDALAARTWQERERHLVPAYEHIAIMHNALGITEPMPTAVTSFFDRPFQVIALHGFAEALLNEITEPAMKRIAQRPCIGSIDQFSDNTDMLGDVERRTLLKQIFRE
jgi:hypothetical protein